MKRFFVTPTLAAVALSLFVVAQTWAGGPSGNGSSRQGGEPSHHGSMSGRSESGHSFRASERFDYHSYGYRSYSWTHSRWSNDYRCYIYWAPRYGWCFYEPTYTCYVPVTYYGQVYPQSAPIVAPSAPVIQQQTTVVTAPSAPTTSLPVPPPGPSVQPPPVAVQKTKVETGAP
jgi:hypothetical protein